MTIAYSTNKYLSSKDIRRLYELFPSHYGNAVRHWGMTFVIEHVFGTVVDMATGKNPLARYLKYIGCKVVAVDNGSGAFGNARRESKVAVDFKGLKVYVRNVSDTHFEDKQFDCSYMHDTFRWFAGFKKQQGAVYDFRRYSKAEIKTMQQKYLEAVHEMCHITRHRIVLVDRFNLHLNGPRLIENLEWEPVLKILDNNNFRVVGTIPDSIPTNAILVDDVRRKENRTYKNERAVYFFIGVAATRRS